MELTIEQLIKIIIGVLVIVAVIAGLIIFGSRIFDFFGNISTGKTILGLI